MRLLTAILVVLAFAHTSAAQGTQGLNPEEMQNYMKLMQEMQACMAKVDRAEMAAVEKRSDEIDAEIAKLCQEGKRDQAQKKAIAFSKEISANQAIQQMKKCSEKVVSMMPEEEKSFMEEPDFENLHVCDEEPEQNP